MSTRPPRIVFAEAFEQSAVERMRAVGEVVVLAACDESTLKQAVRDCDALLVRSDAQVSADVLDHADRLRVIGRGGVGLDNIDLAAVKARGIAVVHTPEAATDAVADLTVGLLIAAIRGIVAGDRAVRGGDRTASRRRFIGRELSDLTIGIVGLGRIGRAVARRCRNGFGMRVLFNDIVSPGLLDFVAAPVEKERLYQEADVVSLHLPLTEATRWLIDDAALSRWKLGSILINTARGGLVESAALAAALHAGIVEGAALDVVAPEPLPAGHPLLSAPNTIFTPHIGARTHAGLARMNGVVEDVIRVLEGAAPRYPAWG